MTEDELYDRKYSQANPGQSEFEGRGFNAHSENDGLERLIATPPTEVEMSTAMAPIHRKGRKMPGTFKYTPEELWDMFRRYVLDFMPGRKLYRQEMLKGGPLAGTMVDIDVQAPMTQETFCLFCDMAPSTYLGYRKRPEYKDTTDMIDAAIFSNNYEMGAVGLIHAGLVARKHGMAEHTDVKSGGETIDVIPIQFSFSRKSLEGSMNKSLDRFDDLN